MRSLSLIINNCFSSQLGRSYHSFCNRESNTSNIMIIPTKDNTFEIPTLVLKQFLEHVNSKPLEAIAVTLNYRGVRSRYKSLDGIIRDSLSSDYYYDRLCKIPISDEEYYYGTNGAIFDKEFLPIMMLTWQVQKIIDTSDSFLKKEVKYKFIKPIIRISPSVFMEKKDSVEKYIINKIMPTGIAETYYSSFFYRQNNICNTTHESFNAKIEIDNLPFLIKKTDTPSISTKNEELFNLVLNNQDILNQ